MITVTRRGVFDEGPSSAIVIGGAGVIPRAKMAKPHGIFRFANDSLKVFPVGESSFARKRGPPS
ncbi:hypothetical protein K270103H11_04780 [Gordonibacter urolithinfaciens]